jgi:hypothetical protein
MNSLVTKNLITRLQSINYLGKQSGLCLSEMGPKLKDYLINEVSFVLDLFNIAVNEMSGVQGPCRTQAAVLKDNFFSSNFSLRFLSKAEKLFLNAP